MSCTRVCVLLATAWTLLAFRHKPGDGCLHYAYFVGLCSWNCVRAWSSFDEEDGWGGCEIHLGIFLFFLLFENGWLYRGGRVQHATSRLSVHRRWIHPLHP